jgi:hypothetical protein
MAELLLKRAAEEAKRKKSSRRTRARDDDHRVTDDGHLRARERGASRKALRKALAEEQGSSARGVISGVPVAARRCFPDFPSLSPPGAAPSDFDLQLRNRRE